MSRRYGDLVTQPDPAHPPAEPTEDDVRLSWLGRRRERIVAEIQRNRRGEYRVPTWVLAALLLLLVGGWAALLVVT